MSTKDKIPVMCISMSAHFLKEQLASHGASRVLFYDKEIATKNIILLFGLKNGTFEANFSLACRGTLG